MINKQIEKIVKDKANRDPWWNTSEKQVAARYRMLFYPENIDKLNKDDFKSFLLIKNNVTTQA